MSMKIDVAPTLAKFVSEAVASGRYASPSEVHNEALRLLSGHGSAAKAYRHGPAIMRSGSGGEIAELLAANGNNKSAVIRYLANCGRSTSEIADALGVRYQFARNVLKDEDEHKARRLAEAGVLERHEADGRVHWLVPHNVITPTVPNLDPTERKKARPNPDTTRVTAPKAFIRKLYLERFGNE